ncbi:MAG: SDR family oxidoreductase [Treponema sp.]|jgi:NAD(P)-dependent dehydrogenase (short-subunit alcohol dehydrogenase family)|nr:SDR family oxidoreductase [Treponema sp.]
MVIYHRLSDKKALIIGGTGGIGRSIALALAQNRAELFIHGGTSQERMESALMEARSFGVRAQGLLSRIDGTVAPFLAFCPEPDIVVAAHGTFLRKRIVETTAEDWRFMAVVNLAFPGALISAVLPGMIARKYGRILLFGGTDTGVIRGFSTTPAYSAAKTGLAVIARSVAQIAASFGVTCNIICPGLVDTEYANEETKSYNRAKSPSGIPLIPETIAQTALHILDSPSLNGAIIQIDGGVSL